MSLDPRLWSRGPLDIQKPHWEPQKEKKISFWWNQHFRLLDLEYNTPIFCPRRGAEWEESRIGTSKHLAFTLPACLSAFNMLKQYLESLGIIDFCQGISWVVIWRTYLLCGRHVLVRFFAVCFVFFQFCSHYHYCQQCRFLERSSDSIRFPTCKKSIVLAQFIRNSEGDMDIFEIAGHLDSNFLGCSWLPNPLW